MAKDIAESRKPDIDKSETVAYVGGAADDTFGAKVVRDRYEAHVADGEGSARYFEWTDRAELKAYIDANGGQVTVVAHSYGADMAAHLVADGTQVYKLVTVDPVGWTRPSMQAVSNNAVIWNNYSSTAGAFDGWDNFIGAMGGAWGSLPDGYATNHTPSGKGHVAICEEYC